MCAQRVTLNCCRGQYCESGSAPELSEKIKRSWRTPESQSELRGMIPPGAHCPVGPEASPHTSWPRFPLLKMRILHSLQGPFQLRLSAIP